MATVTAIMRVSTKKAKKAKVQFRLSDGRGICLIYKSEIEVDSDLWDAKTQAIKAKVIYNNNDRKAFNKSVTDRKNIVLEAYDTEPDKASMTAEILETKVYQTLNPEKFKPAERIPKTIFERFDQYIKDAPLSEGRKKHLRTTYNKVKKFNSGTTFENLDVQYLTEFQNKLSETISKNTTISELRRLRAFYGYANKHGWTTHYPFKSFSIGAESFGDPVFITVEERDQLFSADIPNERLARVRDLFVFQCFVGCRVGDLVKLKKSNIINGCIEYIAAKTKDDKSRVARVPLTEKAKTILSRYDFPNGDLLPYITDQKYNDYLKELFKDKSVNITRIVTIADPKTRESIQKSIADVVTTHMARRVFVGGLHRKGVKNEIIASMSGHTKDSKAFSRYYNINQQDQEQAMKLIE